VTRLDTKRGTVLSMNKVKRMQRDHVTVQVKCKHKAKKCMVREVKRTDLGTEVKKVQRRWKRDGWSVRFVCFKPFPHVLYLRMFSDFFLSSASSSLSLSLVLALSSSLFCRCFMQKNESKDRKAVPACLWFLFLFFFFLLFLLLILLYCLPFWSHSNVRMKERNSLYSLRFFFLS